MKISIQLKKQNLEKIGNRVPIPNYTRTDNKIGIVHIGVGGFHRAHQAYYLHQLQQLGEASEWNICGIGIREGDQKLHDIFKNLTSLLNM